jgi:DNA-binding GntR family transcriptional regulator
MRTEGSGQRAESADGAEAPGVEPLTALVARKLRDSIVSGELEPNQRVTQDSVARRFGVSRIPVREALRELSSEGLVVLEPDVGARVSALDTTELVEVYRMREAIEPMMIADAACAISSEQLADVRVTKDKSERAAEKGDTGSYIELDRAFHTKLLEASGCPRMLEVTRGLWQTTQRYRRVYTFLPDRLEFSVMEHRLILDAIERRSPDDAADLYRAHTRRTRLTLTEHPELFASTS